MCEEKTMRKTIIFLLLIILCFTIPGCKNSFVSDTVSATHFCLDTEATITIYHPESPAHASDIINECFLMCDKFEQEISRTIDTSDIGKINRNSGSYVSVHDETATLIKDSIRFSKASNGAFDISIAPVTTIWNVKDNQGTIPSEEKINDALSHVNYKKIKLKNNTVYIPPKYQLDLGAIAKGYLADKIKHYMISQGVSSAIINLGGNILTIGKKNTDTDFLIGITKPFSEGSGNYSAKININDKSVVTSGIYERYFEKGGKIYHHIFDPKTGFPVENNLYSATIISDSSKDGDALSTAVMVLGSEKGLRLINSLDSTEAVLIDKDYNVLLSDGLLVNSDSEISFK